MIISFTQLKTIVQMDHFTQNYQRRDAIRNSVACVCCVDGIRHHYNHIVKNK